MTALTRAVRRMSEATVRDGGKRRRLVISLYPSGDLLGLRPEKTRREEYITLEAVYQFAIKARVARERREKKEAKRARQKK